MKNRFTGGHYAFQSERSVKPFENPLQYYAMIKLRSDDIVADIGAYVGEYSLYAVNCGVKEVLSYEPTPETFKVLKLNQRNDRMKIYNVAVVGSENQRSVSLYISKGIGVTNSIAKSYKKAKSITVPAISYKEAVSCATVVKIDVEGAEYEYDIVQPNLRAIILEFHPLSHKPWRSWAEKIMEDIEQAGYTCVYRPSFSCGWDLTTCYRK